MEHIDRITENVGRTFRSFGGGQKDFDNPIAEALKDEPLQFAAGVHIKKVVEYVLSESAHDDLLAACKAIAHLSRHGDIIASLYGSGNLVAECQRAVKKAECPYKKTVQYINKAKFDVLQAFEG